MGRHAKIDDDKRRIKKKKKRTMTCGKRNAVRRAAEEVRYLRRQLCKAKQEPTKRVTLKLRPGVEKVCEEEEDAVAGELDPPDA